MVTDDFSCLSSALKCAEVNRRIPVTSSEFGIVPYLQGVGNKGSLCLVVRNEEETPVMWVLFCHSFHILFIHSFLIFMQFIAHHRRQLQLCKELWENERN